MFTSYLYLIIYFKKAIKKTKTTNHDLSSKCNIKNSLVVRTVLVFVGFLGGGGGVVFCFCFYGCPAYVTCKR